MTVTMQKSTSFIESETCTELPETAQSGEVLTEHLYELQEANSRLKLLVCELLMKNQQQRFQSTDKQIAPEANTLES